MNQQVSNALKNLVTQYKADHKAYLDEVDLQMLSLQPNMTKLNDNMTAMVEGQNMIRSLLCRLWTA